MTQTDQDNQDDLGLKDRFAASRAFAIHRERVKVDDASVTKLSKVFKDFTREMDAADKSMAKLVNTARDLKSIWDETKPPGMGGGTGGRSKHGGIPLNGDFLTAGALYGAARLMGGPVALGVAAYKAVGVASKAAQAGWAYGGKRIEEESGYALTADRTGLLLRQMYGGTQLQYQSRWRQPLAGGLIGRGGVEEMLKLQTTMGMNPTDMLRGVEGIRVASGFGYSTGDATKMISAMAQPGSANLMTLMLGMGLYAPGGKARDPMDVIRNTVQRLGLTSTATVQGALQPGSMVRANLSRSGMPEDMHDMVIQYAQENLTFRERGGSGMYDPSNERHRQLMGIDDAYAMEEQRTRQSEVQRSEQFYRRQVDNYAQLERNTKGLIDKFKQLDEVLSTLIGTKANLQNKWWLRVLGKIPGVPNLGDSEHLRDAGMNSGFAASLQNMKNAADTANVPLTLSSGTRDEATQERLFRERHHEDDSGTIAWNGKQWSLNVGASPAAPPGRSLHGLGYAADLGPPESYDWIVANASRFGLRHGASFGEPWHVAPANITSVDQVAGKATGTVRSVSSRRASISTGTRNVTSTSITPADVHLTDGMSMSDAMKAWTDYGRQRIPMMQQGDAEAYGGATITISPTINLNGSNNTAADADMLARRVINLLETSEAIRALRRA